MVHAPRSDLAIRSEQTFWDDKQLAALRQLGLEHATNADLAVFFHQVTRTGLDPFARQIHMIERDGRQTIQTGIDGFRLIARRAVDRSGETLGYEDTRWCGTDGEWTDVWLQQQPPAAAKVVVLRGGQRYPAVALYAEYAGRKRDGTVNRMWREKAALMLAKCAEALALRKAFPQDLSGIYTSDEMGSSVSQATWEPDVDGQVVTETGGAGETRRGGAGSPGETQEPAPAPPPSQSPDDVATRKQIGRIGALMRERGMTDRDLALEYVSGVVGRDVASRNDLTKGEASDVIKALEADTVQEAPPHPDEAPVDEPGQQEAG